MKFALNILLLTLSQNGEIWTNHVCVCVVIVWVCVFPVWVSNVQGDVYTYLYPYAALHSCTIVMLIHLIPEPLTLWLRIRLHVQLIRNVQIVETVHDIGGINGRPFCGQHRIVTARRRRTKKRGELMYLFRLCVWPCSPYPYLAKFVHIRTMRFLTCTSIDLGSRLKLKKPNLNR